MQRSACSILSLGSLLAALAAPLAGQSAAATAKTFFKANTDRQWLAMADLVDSSSQRAMRADADRTAQLFAKMASPAARAMTDSMGAPGFGRMMEGIGSRFGDGSMLRLYYARVTDAAELALLSDREILARWFEAKSPGYLMSIGSGMVIKGMMEKLTPEAGTAMQAGLDSAQAMNIDWDVVGEVAEGESVAHVTYRVAGLAPAAATGVLTFHRVLGGRWRVHFASPNDQLAYMSKLSLDALQRLIKRL